MKILTFSFHFIQYPFLMSIFQFFQLFSISLTPPKSYIIMPYLSAFSHLLTIVQYCIFVLQDILSNSINKSGNKNKSQFTNLYSSESFRFQIIKSKTKRNMVNLIPFLIILGLINIFPHLLYLKYAHNEVFHSSQSFMSILFTSFFCYFVLKTKLYSHHYLALGCFMIVICSYLVIKRHDLDRDIQYHYNNWLIFFLVTFGYIIPTSFREVLEKYIMTNYFISTLKILLFEGICLLIVFTLYIVIFQFIPCGANPTFSFICSNVQWKIIQIDLESYFNFSSMKTVAIFGYIMSVYFASFFRVETINKLTPTHRFVCEMLSQLYRFVYYLIIKDEHFYKTISLWLETAQSFLLIFACFLFNEIIIIKLCKLDYNTKKEIQARAFNDLLVSAEPISLYNDESRDEAEDTEDNISNTSNI